MSANFTPDMTGYKGLSPFRFWCQKTLPLVYDDSLSYYELLCKVVSYINNLITDVAAAEENVDKLLTAYNQLQEYLNNYLDGEEFQEKIDQSLDRYVQNGTLSALVGAHVRALLPAEVGQQIGDVVDDVIGPVVALKLPEVVEDKLPDAIGDDLETIAPPIVNTWLDNHPEATTSIPDGAISLVKMTPDLRSTLESAFKEYNGIVDFSEYIGTASRGGINVSQTGNNVTVNGTYLASARRRYNLTGNLEDSTGAFPAEWYSSKIGEFEQGKTYKLRSNVTGTMASLLDDYGCNIQILDTNGTLLMQNYYMKDGKSESYFTPETNTDIGAVVLTVVKDYTLTDYTITFYLEESDLVTAYVDSVNGVDFNEGSLRYPLKSISRAIKNGAEEVIAKPGVYNERITVNGKRFSLRKWTDDEDYSSSTPYREKIEIISGVKVTVSQVGSTNIYQAQYNTSNESNMYKVFVTHELQPTTQGSVSLEYNALFIGDKPNTTAGNNRQRLYKPVLTQEELTEQGTFYYNGTTIFFHPWNDQLDDAYYVPYDSDNTLISIIGSDSVSISDVRAIGAYNNCIYIEKCNNVKIDCSEFGLCAKGAGLVVYNSNIEVSDCHAFGCSSDGFNLHEYGYSKFCNCTSFYNGDDGISHHQGCTGIIIGGEYAFNLSGGITPAFGAIVDVEGAYSHNNGYGLEVVGISGMRRSMKASNLLLKDNTVDVYVTYNDLLLWNSIYATKQTASYGYITEYNNHILN